MGKLMLGVLLQGALERKRQYIKVDDDLPLHGFQKLLAKLIQIPERYIAFESDALNCCNFKAPLKTIDAIEDGMTLNVIHVYLNNWKAINERATNIGRQPGLLQADIANGVIDSLERLDESKFFICYPPLAIERDVLKKSMLEYLGVDRTIMELSTKNFFFELFKDQISDSSTYKVKLHRKTNGIHVGFQCNVLFDNVSEMFYVKTHHMGPTLSCSKAIHPPDLRELFAYVLLEEIKIGPICHIISSIPGGSKTTLYIATKEIDQLTLMKNLKRNSPNIKETIIQIHVLSFILTLGDVHGDNCGQDINSKPVIFDFFVPPRSDYKEDIRQFLEKKPQCVDTLINCGRVGDLSKLAEEFTEAEMKTVAKQSLGLWKLNEAIIKAEKRVGDIKSIISNRGCIIEGTEDFQQYLKGVKDNVCSLLK